MSSTDDAAPVPERRPVGERRPLPEGADPQADDVPLTRREMKARGMVFTTELPVIPGPVLDTAGGEGGAPVPDRRAVRDRLTEPGSSPELAPAERTATGRRPVVRPPAAARGIRSVDETGTISAVQPVVAIDASAPAADPLLDSGPTDVAASWESAVSIPAIALGIRDRAQAPAAAAPVTPPRAELVAPPIRAPRRESLRDPASRGLPGSAGTPRPPEASPGWSALLEEEAATTGALLSRIAASLAEQTSTTTPPVPRDDAHPDPAVGGDVAPAPDEPREASEGAASPDVASPDGPGAVEAGAVEVGAVEAGAVGVGEEGRRWWPASGVLRFVLLVLVGVAIGLVIVLIANGTLGSMLAGPAPVAPGEPLPTTVVTAV